jgi:hypothetical protein
LVHWQDWINSQTSMAFVTLVDAGNDIAVSGAIAAAIYEGSRFESHAANSREP